MNYLSIINNIGFILLVFYMFTKNLAISSKLLDVSLLYENARIRLEQCEEHNKFLAEELNGIMEAEEEELLEALGLDDEFFD